MINGTCNLHGRIQALLRLGEENWTALGKGVGGPYFARWKPTSFVRLCCTAMPLRDEVSGAQ